MQLVLQAPDADGSKSELDQSEPAMRDSARPAVAHRIVPVGGIFHGHLQPVHHPLASGEEKPVLRDESDPGWRAVLQDRHTRHVLAAGISHRDEIALRADLRYPWVPVKLVGNRGLPSHRHHAPRNAEAIDKPGVLNCSIYLAHECERAETGFETC